MEENDKIEEQTQLDISNLENTSYIQLKRILSFFNHDTQKSDYDSIKNKLDSMEKPLVEKAHYGERIWTYFYQKYLIRIVLFIIAIGGIAASKSHPAVVQASRREFSSSWAVTFVIAALAVIFWKVILAFFTSRYASQKTWLKNSFGIYTVDSEGRQIGFLRSLYIQILKSYSAPVWMILLAMVSENMLSPGTFRFVKIFTGSIYHHSGGILLIVSFLLFILWILDMIFLEVKGRALHDKFSATYVLSCKREADENDRKDFIANNF